MATSKAARRRPRDPLASIEKQSGAQDRKSGAHQGLPQLLRRRQSRPRRTRPGRRGKRKAGGMVRHHQHHAVRGDVIQRSAQKHTRQPASAAPIHCKAGHADGSGATVMQQGRSGHVQAMYKLWFQSRADAISHPSHHHCRLDPSFTVRSWHRNGQARAIHPGNTSGAFANIPHIALIAHS